MLKKLPLILIVFSLFACQSETSDQSTSDESTTPQMPENMQPQADIDVSDNELDLFLEASMAARDVQMKYQKEMMSAIEDEDLALETYSEVAQAIQTGQSPDEIDVSSEDMDRYDRASEVIEEIGQEMQEEIAMALEDVGMEMDRFQKLNRAIQQDPTLQQRIQQKMQESGMMPQRQNPQQQQQ